MTDSDDSAAGSVTGAGSRSAIRLIVNADDFGVSERVNDGIVLAHRSGIVTAASLMAVGRAFEQAVSLSRQVPSLDVGVHLTLVAEKPLLLRKSSLAGDDGRFPLNIAAFLRRYSWRRIKLADIEAEFCAQIERVLDQGLRVTHLDSHQHVHALPGIAPLTQRLASRYGIPFVRVPVEEWRMGWPPSRNGVARLAGAIILRTSWRIARFSGAVGPGCRPLHFIGFTEGGRLDLARLQRLIQALRPGRAYELMCHPGFTPNEPDILKWNYHHEQELLALTSVRIRSEIAARGIQLSSFENLA